MLLMQHSVICCSFSSETTLSREEAPRGACFLFVCFFWVFFLNMLSFSPFPYESLYVILLNVSRNGGIIDYLDNILELRFVKTTLCIVR